MHCITLLLRNRIIWFRSFLRRKGSKRLQFQNFYFAGILLFSPFLLASDNKRENEEQPILLIEPSFLRPPISHLIPGAERTIIVPATMKKNNVFPPTTAASPTYNLQPTTSIRPVDRIVTSPPTLSFLKPGWKTLHHRDMNRFVQEARSHLSETLATLHPKFLRDEHQVIQVALLESTDPLASVTASTILAPDFANGFMNIFGPELLLAIPCSNRVYVFSKLASPLESIAPAIRDDYKLSPSPVSTEIFELSNGRLRAIGSLD